MCGPVNIYYPNFHLRINPQNKNDIENYGFNYELLFNNRQVQWLNACYLNVCFSLMFLILLRFAPAYAVFEMLWYPNNTQSIFWGTYDRKRIQTISIVSNDIWAVERMHCPIQPSNQSLPIDSIKMHWLSLTTSKLCWNAFNH